MMRKIVAFTLMLSLCLLLLPVSGYCERTRWGGTDRDKQLRRQLPYDLIYRGASRGGVSTLVSTVTPLTAAHLAFALIYIENGSPGNYPLPNGEIGQEITIRLLADPCFIIADAVPATMIKSGWDIINLNNVDDWVTLTYLDDTYGWIITGISGATITYSE